MNKEMIKKNEQTYKGEITMKKMKQLLKNEKGLTLIELLAVIVILAIVSAIAIPSIGGIIENSRVGAIKSDAVTALNAANLYFADSNADEVGKTVSVKDLVAGGILESKASLDETTNITKVVGGNTISGFGSTGGMKVEFASATNKDISNHKNSSRDTTGKVVASKTPASTPTP